MARRKRRNRYTSDTQRRFMSTHHCSTTTVASRQMIQLVTSSTRESTDTTRATTLLTANYGSNTYLKSRIIRLQKFNNLKSRQKQRKNWQRPRQKQRLQPGAVRNDKRRSRWALYYNSEGITHTYLGPKFIISLETTYLIIYSECTSV